MRAKQSYYVTVIASERVFCRCVPFVRDSSKKRYCMANKQTKRTRYRFDVHSSSLEERDVFVTRLNRAKQRFNSPGKILARYMSATASLVEPFGVPAQRRRAKTDHARCENVQKQHINVARML